MKVFQPSEAVWSPFSNLEFTFLTSSLSVPSLAEFKNRDGYSNQNWSQWTLQTLASALSLLFFLLSGHCDAEQVERDKHGGPQENPLKDLHALFIIQCKRHPQQAHSQHPKPYHATQAQQHWHGVARWCHFTSISIMHNILPVKGSVILWGRDVNCILCLKLTLPSLYKFTIGLNRQVNVYLKPKNTFIFYFKLNASALAVCCSDRVSAVYL